MLRVCLSLVGGLYCCVIKWCHRLNQGVHYIGINPLLRDCRQQSCLFVLLLLISSYLQVCILLASRVSRAKTRQVNWRKLPETVISLRYLHWSSVMILRYNQWLPVIILRYNQWLPVIILRYHQLEPLIETAIESLKVFHILFSSDIFCQKSCNFLSFRNEFKWDNYIIEENKQDMGVKRFGVRRDKEVREMGRLVSLRINASYTQVETRLPFVFPFVTLRPLILNSALIWTGNLWLLKLHSVLQCCWIGPFFITV